MNNGDARGRPDGRRALLLYIDPALILALKRKALDENRPAYVVVENLLREKLASEIKSPAPSRTD